MSAGTSLPALAAILGRSARVVPRGGAWIVYGTVVEERRAAPVLTSGMISPVTTLFRPVIRSAIPNSGRYLRVSAFPCPARQLARRLLRGVQEL